MSGTAYDRVLVPIADREDAVRTGDAVADRFADVDVVGLYVVEKAGGAPDKASVEQREEFGAGVLSTFESRLKDADIRSYSRVTYGTDVAATILEVADEEDAEAIVFVPRGDRRWRQLLSGDVGRRLLNETDRPIVALPGDRE